LGEMVTVAPGKSYVKRAPALHQSKQRKEVIDSKGFCCWCEGGYRAMRAIDD
jgi:hypothetical protein